MYLQLKCHRQSEPSRLHHSSYLFYHDQGKGFTTDHMLKALNLVNFETSPIRFHTKHHEIAGVIRTPCACLEDVDVANFDSALPLRCLADLHDRLLQFLTKARARTRYVCCAILHAVLSAVFQRAISNRALESTNVKEAQQGIRYWETPGWYMRSVMLRAHATGPCYGLMLLALPGRIGHSLSERNSTTTSSTSEGLMQHSLAGT